METQDLTNIINELKGSYQLGNRYFKHGKPIPFNVLGQSFSDTHPVKVYTIEYKGSPKIDVGANYTIESVQYILNNLTIKK